MFPWIFFFFFFYVGNLVSDSSAFPKSSLNVWKFLVHVRLKPSLKDFERYFASMQNKHNYVVVWTFFGIAFLWDWNENWPFPVLWLLLISKCSGILSAATSFLTVSSFRIWNSSAGIPSSPLALFRVVLPEAHFTLQVSGSRCMITPPWVSTPPRPFSYNSSVYLCHLFLILSVSVRFLPFLPFWGKEYLCVCVCVSVCVCVCVCVSSKSSCRSSETSSAWVVGA